MKRVPLEEVAPGMVLAKPVMNSAGMVVVAAGMALDAPQITHLERIGTASVHVEGAAGEDATKTLEELERELGARFRKVPQEPQLARIRHAICRHLRDQEGASRD
jgi:hypothetical protein